jgi:glycosyltransferase involved in cell wall biosynthesis
MFRGKKEQLMQTKRPPRVAAIVPSTIASCQIGVLKPLAALARKHQIQLRSCLESRASLSLVHWADIIVFCRNTEPAYAHLLSEALSTHKPIVFDLDDNFWDVPFESDPELARYHRLPLRIQQLEKYLTHSTLVRVYSPALRDIVLKFNDNVRLLKAGFDFSLVRPLVKDPRCHDVVRMVYATSRVVDNQYFLFAAALRQILAVYENKVQMTIWGCQPADLVGLPGVRFMPLISNYEKFLRAFAANNFDVGLAPLEDTPFHRSKTNTKFRDYGASQVAGIYSDVCVYSSCIEQEKTGLLVANTTQAWFEGMERMINDAQLRTSIQRNAYDQVHHEYRQEVVEQQWLSDIHELLSDSTSYSLTSGFNQAAVKEVLVRSDFEGFSGVSFPQASPGDNEPVPNFAVEILTPGGKILREASAMALAKGQAQDEIAVKFSPIRNSQFQEFILRFISVPDDTKGVDEPSWLPTSAYIRMNYSKS